MTISSFLTSLLIYTAFTSFNPPAQHTMVVSNLENKKGKLYIGFYNSPESYGKSENPVITKIAEVNRQSEISIPFDNIPDGNYAISIFLDENGNGKMDKNFIGIPKEKYGFSNNVIPATRAANFKEAGLAINKNTSVIAIRLK